MLSFILNRKIELWNDEKDSRYGCGLFEEKHMRAVYFLGKGCKTRNENSKFLLKCFSFALQRKGKIIMQGATEIMCC